MTPHPGVLISRRYELSELIAVGGMGQVWRARDTMLHRDVAVKILRPELARQKGFLARFRSEARSAARLSHPNVAQLYDYGEIHDDGPDQSPTSAYLVMELVPAEPLSATLAEEGRLEPERVIDLLGQIGWGLGAAHAAGVVHRDIKPGNVLVTTEGLVKITDFGVALAKGDVALTDTGQVMGTAQYLSPEQALGEQVTPASDVYSLGVVAYECLAGRLPFPRENAVATALAHVHDDAPPLPPDVPPALSDLVSAMLRKTPQERPGTGREVAVAANAVQSGFRANLPAAEVATLPETTRQDAQSGDESLPGVQDSATERVTFGPLARNGPAQAGQAAEQDPSSTDSAAPASRTTGPTATPGTVLATEKGPPRKRWPRLPLLALVALLVLLVALALVRALGSPSGADDRAPVAPTSEPAPRRTQQPAGTPASGQSKPGGSTVTVTVTGSSTVRPAAPEPAPTEPPTAESSTPPESSAPGAPGPESPATEPTVPDGGRTGAAPQNPSTTGFAAATGNLANHLTTADGASAPGPHVPQSTRQRPDEETAQ